MSSSNPPYDLHNIKNINVETVLFSSNGISGSTEDVGYFTIDPITNDINLRPLQNSNSINIGYQAGLSNPGQSTIAIGSSSGVTNQSDNCIAIGHNAGEITQRQFSVAIGHFAGQSNQGLTGIGVTGLNFGTCVAVGYQSGQSNQGALSTSLGAYAGQSNQGNFSAAVGNSAGQISQGNNSVAIGCAAAEIDQGNFCTAIGMDAGRYNQGEACVAVGFQAGYTGQKYASVSFGLGSGFSNQGSNAIAIGNSAGYTDQGDGSVAIGIQAGYTGQGGNAVAIGYLAGNEIQGSYAIAIGFQAGVSSQGANTIILNATATPLNSTTTDALYIDPIASDITPVGTTGTLMYDNTTKEVYVNTSKTFVIEHPLDSDKYLVHACLEGPEAGVYYRGKSIIEDNCVKISLPEYVDKLATDFTVHITPIYKFGINNTRVLTATEVLDSSFEVYGEPGPFNWIVYGSRCPVISEPLKNEVEVKGEGPYKYI